MRILIAPDSFKHCLPGVKVADALASGIKSVLEDVEINTIPLADGGEGTVQALVAATGGKKRRIKAHDPLMRDIEAEYGIIYENTAVIEMAAASGLELLSHEERNPMITTTYGTGELIRDAVEQGFSKIIVGVGGSATNDGGAGMAEALGARLLDKNDEPLDKGGGQLGSLFRVDLYGLMPELKNVEITVAVDVKNLLTGKNGASMVYAAQKGANPNMVDDLEKNLIHFANILEETTGRKFRDIEGSGAAGGLAAGLVGFLGASIGKGFEMISELVHLEELIKKADLVITGEGQIDKQTGFGKTPYGVATLARKYHKQIVGFAGTLGEGYETLLGAYFDNLYPITEKPVRLEEALHDAYPLLQKAAARMARSFLIGSRFTTIRE